MFTIKRVQFPENQDAILSIYHEYIATTQADLGFQNNDQEFAVLHEKYSTVHSQIFIAIKDDKVAGCAAFRRFTNDICEMKRVYVRPEFRGLQIGEALVKHVIDTATLVGFKKICLDVLPEFKAALKLYQTLGFVEHEPITVNPVAGTHYLGLTLLPTTPQ